MESLEDLQKFARCLREAGLIPGIVGLQQGIRGRAWIAMDPDGEVFVYEACPYIEAYVWINPLSSQFYYLGRLKTQGLKWQYCCLDVGRLLRLAPQGATIPALLSQNCAALDEARHPDCWI